MCSAAWRQHKISNATIEEKKSAKNWLWSSHRIFLNRHSCYILISLKQFYHWKKRGKKEKTTDKPIIRPKLQNYRRVPFFFPHLKTMISFDKNSMPGEITSSDWARQLGSFYSQLWRIGASGGQLNSFYDGCLRGRSTESDLS